MSFAIYETVTNRIVAELESGVVPWTQPWKNQKRGGVMPLNRATGRPYSGINIPILWGAASEFGYPTNQWLTFKQALDIKANVKKGERGTQVVFTKRVMREEDEETTTVSILKSFHVFNVEQIDGLADHIADTDNMVEPIEAADVLVAATKADIRIGGSKACFVPSQDFIAMPPLPAFEDAGSYYATLLHETGHWSGHEARLNRDLKNRFGSEAYAAEELIAELTAAFLCAHLGIEGKLRHASYIQAWIRLLHEDKRAIFTAASKASQAANYLRSFSEKIEEAE